MKPTRLAAAFGEMAVWAVLTVAFSPGSAAADGVRFIDRSLAANLSRAAWSGGPDKRHILATTGNGDRRTLNALGEIALADDPTTAQGYFERLAELEPTDAQVHYNLGQIYLRLGKESSAQSAMERFQSLRQEADAEWLRQNDVHRQRLEAQSAVAAGTPLDAVEIYTRLAAAGAANLDDYLAAGDALLEDGEYPAASSWFSRVLATTPYEQRALDGLALAAEGRGDLEHARLYRDRLELLSWPCDARPESGN